MASNLLSHPRTSGNDAFVYEPPACQSITFILECAGRAMRFIPVDSALGLARARRLMRRGYCRGAAVGFGVWADGSTVTLVNPLKRTTQAYLDASRLAADIKRADRVLAAIGGTHKTFVVVRRSKSASGPSGG